MCPFGCTVLLIRKTVLKISLVPLLFFSGDLSFYGPGFTTMKRSSCRSDYKAMGWRWWKNTAGWWQRQPAHHAAAVQRPVRLILDFSLNPLCVNAYLTICILSSNLSKIRFSPYFPEQLVTVHRKFFLYTDRCIFSNLSILSSLKPARGFKGLHCWLASVKWPVLTLAENMTESVFEQKMN